MSDVQTLVQQAQHQQLQFSDVLAFIEAHYDYQPTAFNNGANQNQATENQGSAKVLYFAQLNHLTVEQTLSLFAEHYQAVLNTPDGQDHQNIRQFMQHGWAGVQFSGQVLTAK